MEPSGRGALLEEIHCWGWAWRVDGLVPHPVSSLCSLFMNKDLVSQFPVSALLPCLPFPSYYGVSLPLESKTEYTLASLSCFCSRYFMTATERKQTQRPLLMSTSAVSPFSRTAYIHTHMHVNLRTRSNCHYPAFKNSWGTLHFPIFNPFLQGTLTSVSTLPNSQQASDVTTTRLEVLIIILSVVLKNNSGTVTR